MFFFDLKDYLTLCNLLIYYSRMYLNTNFCGRPTLKSWESPELQDVEFNFLRKKGEKGSTIGHAVE